MRDLCLPYAHLNLRWNPFAEPDLEQWPGLAIVDAESLAVSLGRPGFAVQLVGEKGRGKTTHLLALRTRFPGAPYVHVAPGVVPRLPEGVLLFVDELQRVPASRRARLFAGGGGLAIGSHEDHAAELRAHGYEVKTRRLEGLSKERLRAIVGRRIEWARRGPGPVPQLDDPAAERLLERFGDDIRTMGHHLYEVFQDLEEVGHVEV